MERKWRIVAHNFSDAITQGKRWLVQQKTKENRLILFGGGEIYSLGINFCQEIELTKVDVSPGKGVKFPNINWNDWNEIKIKDFAPGSDYPGFSYRRYKYKKITRYV